VIEIELHRVVLEHELVVHGHDLELLRMQRELVGDDGVFAGEEFLEEGDVVLVRDDRQPFGHGGSQPAGVIKVVMRDDRVRQRLRTERPRLVDDRLRPLLVRGTSNNAR
jgi:hypothetical protein